MPFHELKRDLAQAIADHLNHSGGSSPVAPAEIVAEFGSPPNIALGHLALPCFKLSKTLGRPSDEVAKELARAVTEKKREITASAAGPYVNFRWSGTELYRSVLGHVFTEGDKYGADTSGAKHRIVLEYGSPNIGKPLGFPDLRGALVGNVLGNVYEFLGYRTERINFIGDWGKPFAKLLAAFEMWGDKTELASHDTAAGMKHLVDIYVRYHRLLDEHPEYEARAAAGLQKLEQGDADAKAIWKSIRDLSLKSMETTLARLNVKFHHVEGESQYVSATADLLVDVKKKAGARLSEGAWIVDIEGVPAPALVQKRDGTTLYLTRDLAAALDRQARFRAEKMYYVVSDQQRLHFQLLFGVLKKMGYEWADSCEHVSVGGSVAANRESRYLALDDLLDDARARALVECVRRTPDLTDREEVAERVGVAAIVFGELIAPRPNDVELKWETIFAWDGDTGPYVLACRSRCEALIAKAVAKGEAAPAADSVKAVPGDELATEEETLVLMLGKFRTSLHLVLRESEPRHLAVYLIDLAKAFDRFYYRFPVLQATDGAQRRLRLNLVEGTRQVLTSGLTLLGIRPPRKM